MNSALISVLFIAELAFSAPLISQFFPLLKTIKSLKTSHGLTAALRSIFGDICHKGVQLKDR